MTRYACHLLAFLAMLTSPAVAEDVTSQIRAEIRRIQRSMKEKPVPDPNFSGIVSSVHDALQSATEAAEAGRVYLSLERLGQAVDLLHGVRAAADKAAVDKTGMPAFEVEWNKVRVALGSIRQELHNADSGETSAGIRALCEVAAVKTTPLLEGSRGFAVSTKPQDGLFYLGQAQGEAEFARFCDSLRAPRKGAPYPARSMLPELQALQNKTNAAFQPPRSVELHPRFIALNSTLKLASELDAAGFYRGALYEYLEAVRHYSLLDQPQPTAARESELKKALATAQKKLDSAKQDTSIAQIFVQRAQSQVAHADGSAPSKDEWRSAAALVDHVLPAYFDAEKPLSPLAPAKGKTVEITLVRWPYT